MLVAAVKTQDPSEPQGCKHQTKDSTYEASSATGTTSSSAPRVRLLSTLFPHQHRHLLRGSTTKAYSQSHGGGCTTPWARTFTKHCAARVCGGIDGRAAGRGQELFVREDGRLAPRVAVGEIGKSEGAKSASRDSRITSQRVEQWPSSQVTKWRALVPRVHKVFEGPESAEV